MTSPPVKESRFTLAFILTFTISAVISPYLPLMVRSLGYSTFLVGILLGIYEGAGVAGPIAFGFWADKTGKYRAPLIVGCIVSALAAFPLALLAHPLASALLLVVLAFVFRSINPLLDAVTTVQIGAAGDYGKIRVWGSISFVLATLFFQWTPFFKPSNAINIAFWLAVTAVVSVVPLFGLPLTVRGESGGEKSVKNSRPDETAKSSSEILTEAPAGKRMLSVYVITGIILIFFSRFSMTAFYTFFPLYLTESLRWDVVGLMFALASSTEIPCILFSAVLIRRFGPMPMLALSTFAVFVRLLLYAVFPFKPVIIAAQMLHSLCFGFYYPAAISFFSRVFPPEKRGVGMSIFMVFGTGLPSLTGNMVGGAIVDTVGFRSLFAIYAAVSGAAALVYGILRKRAVEP